ncbi:hypothetical protein C8C99_1765 [Acidovorax sp. 107]|uniref:hypothetical protein n=1 Tax=Acidovorax sp. 107 TaxID=2135638 RepID=UPI000D34E828|nr:hypothetical protein [Acidovorax sp. 107]PUA96920.1 hypothetical protein C8C99_1765 [Acidovorax sp. 107]
MSRRGYKRHGRGDLSTAVDDTAHLAASFGPVGAFCTGTIGFAVFYTVLPLCMMAWTAERKASLKGSAAATFAILLDQVMWQRLISPCQCAGISILLVCSAIAAWKLIDRADLNDEDVTFLSCVSKGIGRLMGN